MKNILLFQRIEVQFAGPGLGGGGGTGIRVGLAVAKAYAYVQQCPIIELHDQLDLDTALRKYAAGQTLSPFAVQPFYNGEFVIKNPLRT